MGVALGLPPEPVSKMRNQGSLPPRQDKERPHIIHPLLSHLARHQVAALRRTKSSLFIVLWRCVTVITQHSLGNVFHGKSQDYRLPLFLRSAIVKEAA